MESRACKVHGRVSRVPFSGRNADEQSLTISAMERCCCTNGLLPGLTTATCPTSTPATSDGRSSRRKPLGTQDGGTLPSWCLPEVDKHGLMSGPTALLHGPHTAALSRQGGARLPLQELQMRTATLGGGEAKPNVSNFSLAAARLRRNRHEPRYPPLLVVRLRRERSAARGVRF